MALKDFISTSLVQIIEGVAEAQEKVEHLGAKINPDYGENPAEYNGKLEDVATVEFDIAATVTSETETAGEAKRAISIINLSSDDKSIFMLKYIKEAHVIPTKALMTTRSA